MRAPSVAAAAEDAPERLALVGDGPPWTFADLAEAVRARAEALPDGPVILAPEGRRADVVDVLAAMEADRPLGLLHPRWSERERAEARARVERAALPAEVVVFTSGSSGRPKGVRLPRVTLAAAARAHAEALPFEPDDRWLLTLPLAHVGGLAVLTRCLAARATVALGPPRFDPGAVRAAIATHRVRLLSVVPTMLERLLEGERPTSLRAVLLGGAACPTALLARGREAGWPLLPTFGASETCGQICTQRLDDPRAQGVGPPLPGVEVRIADDGEILVRGPTVMAGYLDEPSPLHAGWLHTADLGRLDRDGHLHVLGRADARIVTGGENVDPVEVEAALEAHPGIRRACVVGRPDPTWGQRVVALLECPGEVPSVSALRAFLAPRLAPFKHPRAVAAVDALPLLPNGKRDRRAAEALGARARWSA